MKFAEEFGKFVKPVVVAVLTPLLAGFFLAKDETGSSDTDFVVMAVYVVYKEQ